MGRAAACWLWATAGALRVLLLCGGGWQGSKVPWASGDACLRERFCSMLHWCNVAIGTRTDFYIVYHARNKGPISS